MGIFQYEAGKLLPAQLGKALDNRLEAGVMRSIRAQILEVIARPLFPVSWNQTTLNDEPTPDVHSLTALDPSGQVVIVEIINELNAQTLVAALSRLGVASARSWSQLAKSYPGGAEIFHLALREFKESCSPTARPGARLILVIGALDPEIFGALDALREYGLELHQVKLRELSAGRKILEVLDLDQPFITKTSIPEALDLPGGAGVRAAVSGPNEALPVAPVLPVNLKLETEPESNSENKEKPQGTESAARAQSAQSARAPRALAEPGPEGAAAVEDRGGREPLGALADAPALASGLVPTALKTAPAPAASAPEGSAEAQSASSPLPAAPSFPRRSARARLRRRGVPSTEGRGSKPSPCSLMEMRELDALAAGQPLPSPSAQAKTQFSPLAASARPEAGVKAQSRSRVKIKSPAQPHPFEVRLAPLDTRVPAPSDSAEGIQRRRASARQHTAPTPRLSRRSERFLSKSPAALKAIAQALGEDTMLLWKDRWGRVCEVTLQRNGLLDLGQGVMLGDVQDVFERIGGNQGLDAWEMLRIGALSGPTLSEALADLNHSRAREAN